MDFIGIEAEKCATKWITKNLDRHPDIHLARTHPKETYFFNDKTEIGTDADNLPNYENGIDAYYKYIIEGKVNGEFTATYLRDKSVPTKIVKHFPDTKIIVSLRDPYKRAFSHYCSTKTGGYKVTLKEIIRRSMYGEYLKEWYEYFPKKNIHIIFFDDIEKDPQKVLDDLFEFIGVYKIKIDTTPVGKMKNRRKKFYYRKFGRLSKLIAWINEKKQQIMWKFVSSTFDFREDIRKLENITGREIKNRWF